MAKLLPLSLSLCLLLLSGCFAFREQAQKQHQNDFECQLQRLNAHKPDHRIESEGGFIETWNPNTKPFQCAGAALSRCTLQRNALRRPFYTNAPQQIYIQQGSGIFGIMFSGCPETFEEPRQSQSHKAQDRHQKVYRFREGDLIAVPTGVAFWMYNDEDTPVVAVSFIHTDSFQNQLDQMPRSFYLAGNQEQEFAQYQQSQKGKQQQEENEGSNIFSGFTPEFLEQALDVDRKIVRNLQGENEDEEKGAIVKVEGGLSVTAPPMRKQQQSTTHSTSGRYCYSPMKCNTKCNRNTQEEEEEEDDEEKSRSKGKDSHKSKNGIQETICTMRLRHNIGQTSSPDFFNPQAGSITTATSLDFPALFLLKLSAQFGSLRKNAMFVPHYNLNANSIVYALQGRALIQVVNCTGDRVFDGELQEGEVLIVPQNFAVAAKSQSNNFKYVAFKTNDRPMTSTLAGRNSLLNAIPEEVIQQTFNLRSEQARQIKNNNPFNFLVPPLQSHRKDVA